MKEIKNKVLFRIFDVTSQVVDAERGEVYGVKILHRCPGETGEGKKKRVIIETGFGRYTTETRNISCQECDSKITVNKNLMTERLIYLDK